MLESYFLAGMLRFKGIPVRVRAGYFKDIRGDSEHIVKFWEKVSRARGVAESLLRDDPEKWREVNHAYTSKKNEINHCIEHWICEYWDEKQSAWRLLDANETFLEASCNIDVGFQLPKRYFEFAHEAWIKMRSRDDFNPDQYAEEPQDGRSHIRSQLLWDFFSLLNHDIAGLDRPTGTAPPPMERAAYEFVKQRKFEDLTAQELSDLDRLANALSQNPDKDQLIARYHRLPSIKLESPEHDPNCFIFQESD